MHTLPELPYPLDALEPHISRETLDYHYGRHHRAYVSKLNDLLQGTELERLSLEAVIRATTPDNGVSNPIFNNAAQAWNHAFYWQCLTPHSGAPGDLLSETLTTQFRSVEEFKHQFSQAALTAFGSGWAWLVADGAGKLEIVCTHDADTPLPHGQTPLLTCDLWEHAYYIDYRNTRGDYLSAFWEIVNWDFVAANLRELDKSMQAA
jgi:superoxide dismutase, Fe-Mn family